MAARRGSGLAALVWLAVGACGGDDDQTSDQSAHLSGRVMVTGPLVNAAISVDQLRLDDASGAVREHVGDTTTDADGRYQLRDLGTLNGLFRITAAGGEFTDLATSETVVLDPTVELRSLVWIDLFEDRRDALVSPVGHLVETLARQQLEAGTVSDIGAARDLAAEHLHFHFADLDWSRIDPVSLDVPASSPVDEWRAAVLLGGLALLADDIRNAAGASVQEVNALSLTLALAEDLSSPPFDGEDEDGRGGGLQVGTCPAVDPGCVVPPETPTFCSRGACRTMCDLYSGTLRSLFSGAALKLVRSPTFNQSGVTDGAFLPTARAIADNPDPLLFGTYCTDDVDRVGPTITFDAPPTPDDDAWVKGSIQVRVRATDDIDPEPDLTLLGGLVDEDGDAFNAVAQATIDTTTRPDGGLVVAVEARDAALNTTTVTRAFRIDNTAPVLTIDATGYLVSGSDWWTENPTPILEGTITEQNIASVTIFAGSAEIADATVDGGAWSLTLPPGTIADVAGASVRVEAADLAGNVATISQRIRYDAAPPVVTVPTTNVRDEAGDAVTFTRTVDPITSEVSNIRATHTHQGNRIGLGPSMACNTTDATPTVTKYIHLIDETAPAYVDELAASGEDPRNPIRWQFVVTDDGVGVDVATVTYRVRDVAANTFPVDWTPLTGSGSYSIPLYRVGGTWPSIPVLGTKQGLFEIQFRGADRLGRPFGAARCWQHRLLPPPVVIGPLDPVGGNQVPCGSGATSCAPTHGPVGSGKLALNLLALNDTAAPFDPIAAQVLNDGAPGTAIMQFPVWNAATAPIHLSIDLTNPANPQYSKSGVENRWSATNLNDNTNCGFVSLPGGDSEPNYALPGCNFYSGIAPAQPTTGTSFSVTNSTASPTFGIRVWEEVSAGSLTEFTPCVGCSVTPATGNHRMTVLLPARLAPSPAGDPAYPRKFWIVPVVKTIVELRPNGNQPFSEFSLAGATMTGKIEESRSGCFAYTLTAGVYRCTTRRTYTRYRALQTAAFSMGQIEATIATSSSGLDADARRPPHLTTNEAIRIALFTTWNTTEVAFPPAP